MKPTDVMELKKLGNTDVHRRRSVTSTQSDATVRRRLSNRILLRIKRVD
jgi:hypothetical protein